MSAYVVCLAVVTLLVVPTGVRAQPAAKPQPAVPTQVAVPPAPDQLMSRGEIQVAEAHLQAFGFDPGPVDGIFTAQTQAALRAFQARYGLLVSGLLDRPTRRELLPGFDTEHKE